MGARRGFLSHSRHDPGLAGQIRAGLEASGRDVSVDTGGAEVVGCPRVMGMPIRHLQGHAGPSFAGEETNPELVTVLHEHLDGERIHDACTRAVTVGELNP